MKSSIQVVPPTKQQLVLQVVFTSVQHVCELTRNSKLQVQEVNARLCPYHVDAVLAPQLTPNWKGILTGARTSCQSLP